MEPNVQDPSLLQAAPVYYQPPSEQLLLEWTADSRLFRRRTREYYSSLLVIVFLISLILFFANQVFLIFAVWAFLFVSYVLATIKPEIVSHQITTYGIRTRGRLFYWGELGRFWIRKEGSLSEIHVEAPVFMGSELVLLPANEQSSIAASTDDIAEVIGRYLVYEEPLPTQLDRWVNWIQEKFPLEGAGKKPPRPQN